MPEQLRIHQTLHGYSDGHQLLASSANLTREQESQLLVMSDLTGPTYEQGFETYLSGYPIVDGGLYCIARSWYAHELPRRGCVWTHSLLIDGQDLARIPDVQALAPLFRRPDVNSEFDSYSSPLIFTPSIAENKFIDREFALDVEYQLYRSRQIVVVASNTSARYEDTVLSLFSQQWPRLRRNFRFCTGVLSLKESNYDLAIVPTHVGRASSNSLTSGAPRADLDVDAWLAAAVDDLPFSRSAFRDFLWLFGPDYREGRDFFRALCEIYIAAARDETPGATAEQVLSAIGYFFPSAESSARLKAYFFGTGGRFAATTAGEASAIRALVSHPISDCIPETIASIELRAESLTKADPTLAEDIAQLTLRLEGQRPEQFLKGFSFAFRPDDQKLRNIPLPLAVALIVRKPSLATGQDLWKRAAEEQITLASAVLSNATVSSEILREVLRAILDADAWSALGVACERAEKPALASIVEWIDRGIEAEIVVPGQVFAELNLRAAVVADLMRDRSPGSRSIRVASAFLDARSRTIRSLSVSLWKRAADPDIRLSDHSLEIKSRAFLLARGFDSEEAALIRFSFAVCYEAAATGALSASSWEMLEPYLPWYSPSWDRCARLIRAVVSAFADHSWPDDLFFSTFTDEAQFDRAAAELNRTWAGRRYLRRLCKSAEAAIDGSRRAWLSRYCN